MTTTVSADRRVTAPRWRTMYTVITALVLLVITGLTGGILVVPNPWIMNSTNVHLWHEGQWAALFGLIFCGSLAALLWRPQERPLIAQFLGVVTVVLVLVALPFDPGYVVTLVMIGAVLFLYPNRAQLREFSIPKRPDWLLLGVTLVATLALVPDGIHNLRWQNEGAGGEHAEFFHWGVGATLAIALLVGGLLASTRRPGWQWLTGIIGVSFLYLGIAAVSVPDSAGSWGQVGGVLSVVAGVAFIVVLLRSRYDLSERPSAQGSSQM